MAKPWEYLEGKVAAPDAPVVDNPSGLYCRACRACGLSHCSEPEYCGGLEPMRVKDEAVANQDEGK